ncbi:MAG: phage protein GemA/Gp16 family protein [Chlorobiaceae bacterium]
MTKSQVLTLPTMMVRRIKTLQGLSGMSEYQYRALLSGYGVESCVNLTTVAARAVCEFLQTLVDRIPEKAQFKAKTYEDLAGRSAEMATVKQLRMLEAMWMQVTRKDNRRDAIAAYHDWLKNRFNVGTPEWIERDRVSAIKRALESMLFQARQKGVGVY